MILRILLDILAPILLIVIMGALVQRKFRLDLATLSKINIYLILPAFVFDKVSSSQLPWADMGAIVIFCVLQLLVLGAIVLVLGRVAGTSRKTLAAVALAVLFFNSGNYGLPLAELAFGPEGATVQTFVMLTQNVLTFTVGLALAASAETGTGRQILSKLIRLPVFPTLAAALIGRWYTGGDRDQLPVFIAETTRYLSGALIPLALLTLGAQLASNPRWPKWRPVGAVMILRLLLGPVVMMGLLYAFYAMGWQQLSLWPWPAHVMILTAGAPTAINTLLLTMELDGDTDLSADCVFWTTVASCLTVTLWLAALSFLFGVPQ